ncbi:MAG TPA: FAD-binding oxidoreductase [Candidatus Binatia bacterium]|nr:FAD-binding oxidoreductase [Candidatus Binatia bacterium]
MNEPQPVLDRAWTDLEAIVGREYIWPATGNDAIDGLQPAKVVVPGTAQELAQVLQYCSSAGLAVVPRGGGTKLGWGNRPQKADLILSTERLNRVIEHVWGDMTVIVEAGCTIDKLQRAVAEHGQRLAADPMWPERCTVGGLLATADNGTLRFRYGGVRDLVLGVEVALPDGNLIKAGGKVVKNVAGYDLTKLVIGSLGTLGIITRAAFRLHPVPVATATYSTRLTSTAEATRLVLAMADSQVVYTGLQLRADGPDHIRLDVRFEGIPESLQDQYGKLGKVAAGYALAESSGEVWNARQELFAKSDNSVICKCSVLPTEIGALCDGVFRHAQPAGVAATLVVQSTGVAEVRLDSPRLKSLLEVVDRVRDEVALAEGTLVVERCPASMKESLEVWGTLKDAVPLMQQIKGKFDPAGTLNPGRFVGAI